MSVRLTSSGLQGDYGRPVYTIYFNGEGVTGTNFPIGSVIEIYRDSSISLVGKWSGFRIMTTGIPDISPLTGITSTSWGICLLQRTS